MILHLESLLPVSAIVADESLADVDWQLEEQSIEGDYVDELFDVDGIEAAFTRATAAKAVQA